MRAFIAIVLPDAVLNELAKWQKALRSIADASSNHRSAVKWARPEGIHLTLKFLGEIDAATVQRVTSGLEALGSLDQPAQRITLELKGLGCFPNCKRPRVLWAGVSAPPALLDLAAGVEAAMRRIGFPAETRPFSPHLTLARVAGGRPQPWVEPIISEREAGRWDAGRFEVSEFCLFESLLSPGAPARYRRIASFTVPSSEILFAHPAHKE